MSRFSEIARAQGLAVMVRRSRERARSCWLSIGFAQGLGGCSPARVEADLLAACDDVERWTLEWHAARSAS